ncbi:hypothetical protein [Paenibacillus xylaniclasticus]|uniref:hypothetical protein n=1 Tax=Paenibacillus xylaniclasticus TaxID=588083 RepID=UPI000FDA6496|nr:hypothetical protein [Paenibacillus xylaniclasticus]GFN33985.1 hypothetical protein PCURB6_42450 [Paenibacillus curdlanolyticus]
MEKVLSSVGRGHKVWSFTVGIVTAPAASEDRKSTGSVYIHEIFAIPQGAAQVDAAWGFIQYFNGEDYAQQYYKRSSISAPLSRMVKEYSGYKLDAFYKLKPSFEPSITSYALTSSRQIWK